MDAIAKTLKDHSLADVDSVRASATDGVDPDAIIDYGRWRQLHGTVRDGRLASTHAPPSRTRGLRQNKDGLALSTSLGLGALARRELIASAARNGFALGARVRRQAGRQHRLRSLAAVRSAGREA